VLFPRGERLAAGVHEFVNEVRYRWTNVVMAARGVGWGD